MSIRNYAKRCMALVCAVMMALTIAAAPGVTAEAAAKVVTATTKTSSGTGYANTSVNVRKGASYNSKVVVVLKKNDAVKITGNKNGWLKVTVTHKSKTYKGYMGAKYVNLNSTETKKAAKKVSFKKLMSAIMNIREGSAGTSLRAQEALKTLKAYAKNQSVKTNVESYKSLAAKWIKAKAKKNSDIKSELKDNLEALQGEMSEKEAADVVYLQIINGILRAC